MQRHGYNWQETLELAVWADREVISAIPDGVRTAIHQSGQATCCHCQTSVSLHTATIADPEAQLP
jgi:hypothetical protein